MSDEDGLLGATEEQAYVALLRLAVARSVDLARLLKVHEDEADRLLRVLTARGLAAAQPVADRQFRPLPPDLAFGATLVRRQESLSEMLWFCRANAVAMSSEENTEEFDALRRGVRYRVICERDLVQEPGMLQNIAEGVRCGEQARMLPVLPVRLAIADRRLAICPLVSDSDRGVGEPAAALIGRSQLLDALVALFETHWRLATRYGYSRRTMVELGRIPLNVLGFRSSWPDCRTSITSSTTSRSCRQLSALHPTYCVCILRSYAPSTWSAGSPGARRHRHLRPAASGGTAAGGDAMRAWRAALRIARREARRTKGRSALVVAMIAVPVLSLSFAASMYDMFTLRPHEQVARQLGTADAQVRWIHDGPIEQDVRGEGGGPRTPENPSKGEVSDAELLAALPAGSRVMREHGGSVRVRTAAGIGEIEARGIDLSDPLWTGRVVLRSGRAPARPDGVALTAKAIGRLGSGVGRTIELADGRRRYTVTGIVEFPSRLGEAMVFRPDGLPAGVGDADSWGRAWPIVGVAVGTGVLGALVPAFVAARQDVVAALSGRRGATRSRKRWLALGLAMCAVGGRPSPGTAPGAWQPTRCSRGSWSRSWVWCCVPRLGRFLPLAPRIALRDTARNRAAAAPAISAVMAAVAGAMALGLYLGSSQAQQEVGYRPYLPMGYAEVQVYGGKPADDAPRVPTAEEIRAALRDSLPVADTVDVYGWLGVAGRRHDRRRRGRAWLAAGGVYNSQARSAVPSLSRAVGRWNVSSVRTGVAGPINARAVRYF